ncbi:MAG TPA: CDGSH iron-sulfur domain-containing protein [Coriobacteriia bacterium]|nr:CDGSH iron-sulfur domain-containing protein [Coriobacteriia bacterium]
MRIRVTEHGPYLVTGGVPIVRVEIITNAEGESVEWRTTETVKAPETYRLCRCGLSEDKPFCDMTHVAEGFDGTETAGHTSYAAQAVPIDGPGVRLHDARRLCAEARFCDRAEGLWNLVERCDDPEALALAMEEAMLCPSGRYVLSADARGLCEPEYAPSIAIVDDPSLGVSGPLWVRGGIPVVDAEGEPYEVRNRVTLCRCGSSANKPFCDGSHIAAGFRDEG